MATVRKTAQTRTKSASAKNVCELTVLLAEVDAKLETLTAKQTAFLEKTYVSQKVHHKQFGEGIVIEQKEDVLKIHFPGAGLTKFFVIHEKFANRPIFEQDAEVVSEFTEYGNIRQIIIQLKQEKARLEKKQEALLAELPH